MLSIWLTTLLINALVIHKNMQDSRSVESLMQAVWQLYLVDIVAEMINRRISNAQPPVMQQMGPGINISTFRNMCSVREEHTPPGLYLEKHVVLVTCRQQRVSVWTDTHKSHTRGTMMIECTNFCYFMLHYIYLTTVVTSYSAGFMRLQSQSCILFY